MIKNLSRRRTTPSDAPTAATLPSVTERSDVIPDELYEYIDLSKQPVEPKQTIDHDEKFVGRAKVIMDKYFPSTMSREEKVDSFIEYAYEYVFYNYKSAMARDYCREYVKSKIQSSATVTVADEAESRKWPILYKERLTRWADLFVAQHKAFMSASNTYYPKQKNGSFVNKPEECSSISPNAAIDAKISALKLEIPDFSTVGSTRDTISANKLVVCFHYLSYIGVMNVKKKLELVNPDGTHYTKVTESHAVLPGILTTEGNINMNTITSIILRLFAQMNMIRKLGGAYVILRAFYTFHIVDQDNTFIVACKRKNACIDPMCEFVHTCPYIDARLAINMLANKYYNLYVTRISNLYSGRSLNKIADVSNPLIKFPMIAKSIYTHCIKYSQFMNTHISMNDVERAAFTEIARVIGDIDTSDPDKKRKTTDRISEIRGSYPSDLFDNALFKYRNINKIKTIQTIGTLLNLFRYIYKIPMHYAEVKELTKSYAKLTAEYTKDGITAESKANLESLMSRTDAQIMKQNLFIDDEKTKYAETITKLNKLFGDSNFFNGLDISTTIDDDSDGPSITMADALGVTRHVDSKIREGELSGADGGPLHASIARKRDIDEAGYVSDDMADETLAIVDTVNQLGDS